MSARPGPRATEPRCRPTRAFVLIPSLALLLASLAPAPLAAQTSFSVQPPQVAPPIQKPPAAQPAKPAPPSQPAKQPPLSGRVLDAFSMQPIIDAVVQSGGMRAVTDASGRFALDLPPGEVKVADFGPRVPRRRGDGDDRRRAGHPRGGPAQLGAVQGRGHGQRSRRSGRTGGARHDRIEPAPGADRGRRRREHLQGAADAARRQRDVRLRQPDFGARRRPRSEPHDHGRRGDPRSVPVVRPGLRVQPGDGAELRADRGRVQPEVRRPAVVDPRHRQPRGDDGPEAARHGVA